jgi:hypothetical protein
LELKPLDVLTSFGLEIEMRLATFGGMEAFTRKCKVFQFANYKLIEIATTYGFTNEALHS